MIPIPLIAIATWLLLVLWIPFMWGFWMLVCIGGFGFWWSGDRGKKEAEKERRKNLPRSRSIWPYIHLMCAACWNERRDIKTCESNVAESESCCWCGNDTTSGIWVRKDLVKMPCHHCEFEDCIGLAPVGIAEVWVCTHHIEWAMDLAFEPMKEAMKVIGERP